MDLFYLTNFLVCGFNKSQVQFLRPEEIKKHVYAYVWLIKTVRKLENHCRFLPCADFMPYIFGLYILTYPFWYLSLIGPSVPGVFLVSSSYQSQIASDSKYTLTYHTKGPCCSRSNQIQSCKVSKSLLKLKVKQIPLPYCLHAFVVKDNPKPGSPSTHTHLVTACFPYFPTTAEAVGCSSEAWLDWIGRYTISPFLNCKTVCKIVKLFIKFQLFDV